MQIIYLYVRAGAFSKHPFTLPLIEPWTVGGESTMNLTLQEHLQVTDKIGTKAQLSESSSWTPSNFFCFTICYESIPSRSFEN